MRSCHSIDAIRKDKWKKCRGDSWCVNRYIPARCEFWSYRGMFLVRARSLSVDFVDQHGAGLFYPNNTRHSKRMSKPFHSLKQIRVKKVESRCWGKQIVGSCWKRSVDLQSIGNSWSIAESSERLPVSHVPGLNGTLNFIRIWILLLNWFILIDLLIWLSSRENLVKVLALCSIFGERLNYLERCWTSW